MPHGIAFLFSAFFRAYNVESFVFAIPISVLQNIDFSYNILSEPA